LQNVYGGVSGLSQTDILRRYISTPRGKDKLKRDENSFYKKVWPMLEQLRKKDKTIQSFDKIQFGREIPIWQLK